MLWLAHWAVHCFSSALEVHRLETDAFPCYDLCPCVQYLFRWYPSRWCVVNVNFFYHPCFWQVHGWLRTWV